MWLKIRNMAAGSLITSVVAYGLLTPDRSLVGLYAAAISATVVFAVWFMLRWLAYGRQWQTWVVGLAVWSLFYTPTHYSLQGLSVFVNWGMGWSWLVGGAATLIVCETIQHSTDAA